MVRRSRTLAALIAMAVALGLLGSGCGSDTKSSGSGSTGDTVSRANQGMVESSDTPKVGGKLVYALTAESNGWNPATNQWAPSGLIVSSAIFDHLTAYDDKSQIKPFLAESFTPNADMTQWTFKLRPNITLTNGKPVDADLVIRNQQYLSKSPITGPAYKYSGVTSFTKQDALTFLVTLSRPSAVYPIAFATQLGVVADPDWLESNDGLKPIGSGPFILDSWEIGNKLTVRKNPSYWRKDAAGTQMPYLDSVEFRMIPDSDTRTKALQAKDVDVVQTFAGQQVQNFQNQDGIQIYSDSKGESREQMVMLNTQAPPFNDPDARRALALATDRRQFSDTVSNGFDELASGFIAPSSPWYSPSDYPDYDLTKAKELVEQVKAKNGGSFRFTLQGVSEPESKVGAQTLIAQWQAAGIDVQADLTESAKLIIGVVAGGYQSVLWGQFDSPNPYADGVWIDPDLATPPPEFTLNFSRIKDPAIGDALRTGGQSSSFDVQKQQMAVVQQQLGKDIPFVWLTHIRESLIASDRVVNLVNWTLPDGTKGLDLNQGGHPLTQVWLR